MERKGELIEIRNGREKGIFVEFLILKIGTAHLKVINRMGRELRIGEEINFELFNGTPIANSLIN